MDRAVIEALLHRGLDQAVLIEAREALELGGRDRRPQVVAGAGLIDHLDRGAGQGRLDHSLDLCQVSGHSAIVWKAPRRIVVVEREDVYFPSGKERCGAWLFQPAGASIPAPCLIMASGFSCVRDQGLDAYGERFAAAGFAVLAFDYRYFANSSGEPRQLVRAGRQRDDWRAALAYARSLDLVDDRRIALWGFSAGGGHVQSLTLTEGGIGAAICVAPLVDGARTLQHIGGLPHVIRLGFAGIHDSLRALRGADAYRIPAAGPPGSNAVINTTEGLREFESITPPGSNWRNEACARTFLAPPYRLARKARRIPIPILYCITEGDEVAPPALGMKAAGRAPHGELRTYAGGHFDPFRGETVERMAADQIDFLTRRLTAS